MMEAVRRIKGTARRQREPTANLMDVMHRSQLDAFISRLFSEIECQKGFRYDELLSCYKNMIVEPCVNIASQDNEQHIELEYIRFQSCDYLYHRETNAVYTFDTVKPQLVGYYDSEADNLKLI